ncbi:hypothetical protein EOD39_0092 [Acipenser ruthenus]|uniref:EF-hand domain-containing protein n=1 Tax=Acipenser ruthenus TaxID=7906 RepID=A0A444UQG8_ACIRT|nr:hypothetical protein EOD39_0092 [Acipenser ruthenus]
MTLREFHEALTDMLGSERWTSQMELLFNKVTDEELLNSGKIGGVQGASRLPWSQSESFFSPTALYVDTSCDGYVDWDEFCTYMKLQYKEKDFVDTSCDGYVDWDEFCTYMKLQYKEKDFVSTRRRPSSGHSHSSDSACTTSCLFSDTGYQGSQLPHHPSKIMYLPMGDLIITSSGSTSTSVVIMDLNRKNKVYTWKIHKVGLLFQKRGLDF